MADTMLAPLITATADRPDDLRQIVVDWMAASWVRKFDAEEGLDLVHRIVTAHPQAFTADACTEMVTRTLWRMENLLAQPDAEPEAMAAGLMDLMLNADPRYLASVRLMNTPFADGEG